MKKSCFENVPSGSDTAEQATALAAHLRVKAKSQTYTDILHLSHSLKSFTVNIKSISRGK